MADEGIRIGSNSYEEVKTFKYLVSLLKNLNSIHEKIKCRLMLLFSPNPFAFLDFSLRIRKSI